MQSLDWLETERTRLRPLQATDAEACFTWFSDPEVMRFIPSGPDRTLDDTRRRIAGYMQHEQKHGFSKRLIIDRDSGAPMGDSGLYHLPDGERIELGFRFARSYWGQGYAYEVGTAWQRWFDEQFPGRRLFADVHAEHSRSQRVLTKLGFAPSHEEIVYGMPMWIYEWPRHEDAES